MANPDFQNRIEIETGILESNKRNHQDEPLRNEEDKGQPLTNIGWQKTNKSKHWLMRPSKVMRCEPKGQTGLDERHKRRLEFN